MSKVRILARPRKISGRAFVRNEEQSNADGSALYCPACKPAISCLLLSSMYEKFWIYLAQNKTWSIL